MSPPRFSGLRYRLGAVAAEAGVQSWRSAVRTGGRRTGDLGSVAASYPHSLRRPRPSFAPPPELRVAPRALQRRVLDCLWEAHPPCPAAPLRNSMSALEWYAHKSLGDGIFWIQERFYESGNRANIWLVRGSEQDVVIDTGLGLRSLPEYLYSSGLLQDCGAKEDAGRRPLLAVATHVHFDHSGGLYQFDQVAVHRAEAEALARGDNFETVTWLSDSEVVRAPSPGWRARQFRVQAVQPTLILQDGNGPRGRALSLREGLEKRVQHGADLRGPVGLQCGNSLSHPLLRESQLEQSLGPGRLLCLEMRAATLWLSL